MENKKMNEKGKLLIRELQKKYTKAEKIIAASDKKYFNFLSVSDKIRLANQIAGMCFELARHSGRESIKKLPGNDKMDEEKAEEEFATGTPLIVLCAVGALMNEAKIDYMIIGGVATAAWGMPRPTYDVDIMMTFPRKKITQLLLLAAKHGFLYQEEEIERLLKSDMIRLRYKIPEKDFSIPIDCIFASVEYQQQALQRKQKKKIDQHWIWFASPEDVAILKLISFRGRDQLDIESVLIQQGEKFDLNYVKKWAKKFGLGKNLKLILKKLSESKMACG
ncbi:hypothetical protein AUJ66_07285 [Candidatus Desantisbacteria bacterium CG1_02_38_46]|uniref:Nucleotidyltransferase n=3 Tax=unclassified Candidatus Desantisiibacteriota TaxID=3106372 RepID=A0A2H9P9D7_9BACT|nr:MAG: hypothetical protein AUJ66_07285 [Candidatus Desantisbacteria bacterium CG1_02_38_46]PIU51171.1 MAG: hypothetical protein COS91_05960 [Candidatus Desantisbacteria bacterium CG07_land_8_20_14_0_80_39_15]PIZ14768.1 MAG: hypothetical protein COY51_07440 [Candidatus Desantisbacteria bacterium CG_4_10_14_0_8_um_filter_39_17]